MQITPIPCLNDNYAYIISDDNFKIVGVVDPSEAPPIISFLNKKNASKYLLAIPRKDPNSLKKRQTNYN